MKSSPGKLTKKQKRNFSGFTKKEAFQHLNLTDLLPWAIALQSVQPSSFFEQRLTRLRRHFDLESYEESKKLLIDAICEEGMENFDRLKIWKGAKLESDTTIGNADYLIAEQKRYLEAPLLCIIEAKKDDFEQGLAQCLVEMQACQWQNLQMGKTIDVLGIVTNGSTWQFYRLVASGEVYETLPYGLNDLPAILGALHFIFQICDQNLNSSQ
jgi:hypothetical protein